MVVVIRAALLRQRLPWTMALLVLALAASPLICVPTTPLASAQDAITGIAAMSQHPDDGLPEEPPVAVIPPGEAGLEESRATGQRPALDIAADSRLLAARAGHVFLAAAAETARRHAQRRLLVYPLDPHLRLLNPGHAPPLV